MPLTKAATMHYLDAQTSTAKEPNENPATILTRSPCGGDSYVSHRAASRGHFI
jgi:hypothetical protein